MRPTPLLLILLLLFGLVTPAFAETPLMPKRKGKGAVIKFTGGTKPEVIALLKKVRGVIRAEPTHRAPDAEDLVFVEYDPNRVSLYGLSTLAAKRSIKMSRFAFG